MKYKNNAKPLTLNTPNPKKRISFWSLLEKSSFKEEVATYVAQVLKLPHYRVCLKFSVGRYTGDVGLVKDLETGTYFYVVKDNTAQQETTQKENKYFHFTSEEVNSEK